MALFKTHQPYFLESDTYANEQLVDIKDFLLLVHKLESDKPIRRSKAK